MLSKANSLRSTEDVKERKEKWFSPISKNRIYRNATRSSFLKIACGFLSTKALIFAY